MKTYLFLEKRLFTTEYELKVFCLVNEAILRICELPNLTDNSYCKSKYLFLSTSVSHAALALIPCS